MNTKIKIFLIYCVLPLFVCFLGLRGFFRAIFYAKIPETIVSNVINIKDREFYLTMIGNPYRTFGGDGPYEYRLNMNIVTEGEKTQKLVASDNDVANRKVVLNLIQEGYTLSLDDEIPHIFINAKERDMGFFHTEGLEFLRTTRPLDLQKTRVYSINREKAKKLISEQIDLSRYNSYYYVNESLCGASSKTLISREERSLIILGDNFRSHCPVYTRGDIYSTKKLRSVVASDNMIFIVESEKETERRKRDEDRKGRSDIVAKEIIVIPRAEDPKDD